MDDKTIKIYKRAGETPLQRLERLRKEEPEYGDKKLSYAGRLDPMAEGIMLVLTGDANKEREKYLKYSKEYIFEILFGFATDSYDLLGLVTASGMGISAPEPEALKKILSKFKGEIEQEYPPYSSKTVRGKPLFEWARIGKIEKIKIPFHKIIIHDLEIKDEKGISKSELRREILTRIMRVKGNFRQKEILDKWDEVLEKSTEEEFQIFKLHAFVSSGAYIRVLANDIGKIAGVPALAFHIKREDVKAP